MRLTDLHGKKVCILGFGKEGKSAWTALQSHAPDCAVTIVDANPDLAPVPGATLKTGDGYLDGLDAFDVIIKSPGIAPNAQLAALGSRITTPTNIFFDEVSALGAIVVGITGSKGKSTTTSLINHLLARAKLPAILCGNIGVPALEVLPGVSTESILVMELSSYQLMDATQSPHIAVLTSFFPEHLDYHGSLEAYFDAKANIVKFQNANDLVFFNAENSETLRMAKMSKGEHIPFTHDECPLPLSETKLIGDHNKSNIAAAYKVARHLGVDHEMCLEGIRTFKPLPHRLQSLGLHHGIHWIDDAISTTPDSAIAALRALGADVATIILGGTDRGLTFESLAKELVQDSQVSTVILFPGTGPKIRKEIEKELNKKIDRKIALVEADTMEKAVQAAKDAHSNPNLHSNPPIVLLSTASPSYNMFKNFEEKGEQFQRCILKQ